jgi:hypothetical protein
MLHWVPQRWFGRGTFECEHCGEFPDLAEPADRTMTAAAPPINEPRARPRKHDGRPRVLLVDDSAEYRDLYAVMLEQTATVITASRGEEALAIASAETVDAIVLDGLGVPEAAARVGAASVLIKPCPVERLAFAIKMALH